MKKFNLNKNQITKITKLQKRLSKLHEIARELIDCGNSKEQMEGYGMETVIYAVYKIINKN